MTGLENICPKCSCMILSNDPKAQIEHNKSCKSTAVSEGAKTISNYIDKMVLEDCLKKAQPVKTL